MLIAFPLGSVSLPALVRRRVGEAKDGFDLNFENTPIATVAKLNLNPSPAKPASRCVSQSTTYSRRIFHLLNFRLLPLYDPKARDLYLDSSRIPRKAREDFKLRQS